MTVSAELCCVALPFCCVIVALPFFQHLLALLFMYILTCNYNIIIHYTCTCTCKWVSLFYMFENINVVPCTLLILEQYTCMLHIFGQYVCSCTCITYPTENSLRPGIILPAASCTGHSRPHRDRRHRKNGIKQPVPV